MTLKNIILNVFWEDVKESILKYFPDEKKSIVGFVDVFHVLRFLPSKISPVRICIEVTMDETDHYAVHVYGKNGSKTPHHSDQCWHLDYVDWEEILGMVIDPETKQKFSDADIVALCLWEITFYGYDQESIQQKYQELKKMNDQIRDMSPEALSTFVESLDIIREPEENPPGEDPR